jgi:hypothetical protein
MILVDHWLDDVRPIVAWAVMPGQRLGTRLCVLHGENGATDVDPVCHLACRRTEREGRQHRGKATQREPAPAAWVTGPVT